MKRINQKHNTTLTGSLIIHFQVQITKQIDTLLLPSTSLHYMLQSFITQKQLHSLQSKNKKLL